VRKRLAGWHEVVTQIALGQLQSQKMYCGFSVVAAASMKKSVYSSHISYTAHNSQVVASLGAKKLGEQSFAGRRWGRRDTLQPQLVCVMDAGA
jgi:hypothetical protein